MDNIEEGRPVIRAVGAHRAAVRLAKRAGLAVGRADIEALVSAGALSACGEYNGWPTYHPDSLDAVPLEVVQDLVAERESWLRASVDDRTAAAMLGLRLPELKVWVAGQGVVAGRFGRYATVDVARLVEVAAARPDPRSAAVTWAKLMRQPGVAVVLDTETADLDGAICEVAVVEAADGTVLLDTFVDPQVPITEAARQLHGIGPADIAGAPLWKSVLPNLLAATAGRRIVAYNAEYDRRAIQAECARCELDAGHLGMSANWECLMRRRTEWSGGTGRLALGGPHRAAGDCRAALEVLRAMSGVMSR